MIIAVRIVCYMRKDACEPRTTVGRRVDCAQRNGLKSYIGPCIGQHLNVVSDIEHSRARRLCCSRRCTEYDMRQTWADMSWLGMVEDDGYMAGESLGRPKVQVGIIHTRYEGCDKAIFGYSDEQKRKVNSSEDDTSTLVTNDIVHRSGI